MLVSLFCNQYLSHACGIDSAAPNILKICEGEMNRLAVLPYANFRLRKLAVWLKVEIRK
jgi:hypothetical protein